MPPALFNPANLSSPAGSVVVAAYVQPLLEQAHSCGVALPALTLAAGLAPQALQPLPETLAAAAYVRLLDAGAALCADPHFGLHVGERFKLGSYSVYGLVLLSCSDVGQALQQTLRYEGLAHDLGRSALALQQGEAQYRWHSHFPQASRHLAESVFAGIRVCADWLLGSPLPLRALRFAHAAPADDREHRRIFGLSVQFGATDNVACFDAAVLAQAVPHADASLYPLLRQHAEDLLQAKLRAQEDGDVLALVRATLVKSLAQDRAHLSQVAEALGWSTRSLQRRLQASGWRFADLLEHTRRELAQDYLRQGRYSLTDIAFLLGYQEQSAFSHAFKGWTGLSPGRFREQAMELQKQ